MKLENFEKKDDLMKYIFFVEQELNSFQYAEDFIHLFNIRYYLDMIKSLHYHNHMSVSIFHFLYNQLGSMIMFTIQKEDNDNYNYNIKKDLIKLQEVLKNNYHEYM